MAAVVSSAPVHDRRQLQYAQGDRARPPPRPAPGARRASRDRRRHCRAAGGGQALRRTRLGGSARADRQPRHLQAGPFRRPPQAHARRRPQAHRPLLQGQHPQHRLARQCDPGEAPHRRARLRRAQAPDARAARSGDGRAPDRRPPGADRRHAPRPLRAVAQAADARDPRRRRSRARRRCRRC